MFSTIITLFLIRFLATNFCHFFLPNFNDGLSMFKMFKAVVVVKFYTLIVKYEYLYIYCPQACLSWDLSCILDLTQFLQNGFGFRFFWWLDCVINYHCDRVYILGLGGWLMFGHRDLFQVQLTPSHLTFTTLTKRTLRALVVIVNVLIITFLEFQNFLSTLPCKRHALRLDLWTRHG